MFESDRSDAIASAELGGSDIKERLLNLLKIGFVIGSGILGIQIFMDAVYFAHL
jgi:hypothetical protein|tara:strand:- start:328 stop:489 length:162 start_codon:yes stop_codon:yes gene_type:complete